MTVGVRSLSGSHADVLSNQTDPIAHLAALPSDEGATETTTPKPAEIRPAAPTEPTTNAADDDEDEGEGEEQAVTKKKGAKGTIKASQYMDGARCPSGPSRLY